jgi:phosphomannomutase
MGIVSAANVRINRSHDQKARGMDADDEIYSSNSIDAPDPPVNVEAEDPSPANGESETGDRSEEPAGVLTGPIISLPTVTEYRCPGEEHSISRAIHLSRLAAFYPSCRQCQHRHDTGQLNPETVERINQSEVRGRQRPLFHRDGVRGVFLNEFTPAIAGRIAAAFASVLWQDVPLTGRQDSTRPESRTGIRQPSRRGPSIVVGYDERPSSPAILSSVIDALRMMGCPVTDIGLVSRPCFAFAVDHLQVAGGLFVSGAGHDASWAGLDLYREGAVPLSLGEGLEEVQQKFDSGVTRPTRSAAFQRAFQATIPYEAGLWKHFHALRPLRVVCAARPRPARKTIRKLFAQLPCELSEVETTAAVNAPLKHDVLMERIVSRVKKRQAHLGILIDGDGSRCWFVDEKGKQVDSARLTAMLARQSRIDHPNAPVVAESAAAKSVQSLIAPNEVLDGGDSAGSISRTMRESNASFGGSQSDSYWFRESFPACDAILTLAHVLQGLSRSDESFSKAISFGC